MLTAVVFDFDGVLADTEPLHFLALREAMRSAGIDLSETEYYKRYVGLDDEDGMKAIAGDRGQTLEPSALGELMAHKARVTERLMRESGVLFPGAAECVQRMQGHVLLGIASGARRVEIDIVLERVGLTGRFACIVAAGDTERPKPAPDPYLHVASSLGVSPQSAVAIEDSRFGLEAARVAGLKTVAITNSLAADKLTAADVIVSHLDEVTLDRLRSLVGASSEAADS
jgi:HAD superfamily hydrolase (TIGR01509 family)